MAALLQQLVSLLEAGEEARYQPHQSCGCYLTDLAAKLVLQAVVGYFPLLS